MNYPKTKFPFYVALSITFLLTSCGSYQYVGYDNDGIYGSDDRVVEEEVVYEKATTVEVDDNSYYKNYFAEKDNLYSTIPTDESAIFTDIDSYSSDYVEEDDEQTGYAGWGNANENVTINFYDNGWNNWGFGGWGWNAGFGWGNPWWGWNRWYRPWGWNSWAWNGWGWNAGWGWGWNNWGWNAGFGWGWNNWGWNGFYQPFYRNNYAFNAGRRGANVNGLNRRALYSNRANSNYSRRSGTSARNRSSYNPRRNSNSSVRRNTRSIRSSGNNSSIRRPNTRTRSNSPSVRTRTRSNSNSRSRMSTPSRSRSSSPSMRSGGGSMRSSGGSVRSGGSRGGGRRG